MKKTKKEKYELKIKNFWRNEKKLISLIAIAAVVGVILAGLNTWYFANATTQSVIDEPQVIDTQSDATFSFELDSPQLASETTMTLEIQNIGPNTDIYVDVNNEEIQQISSDRTSISLPSEILENDNEVRIYKREIDFEDQELVSADISSSTNIEQITFVIFNLASLALIFTPIGYIKYQEFVKRRQIEDRFPAFLRDIVQGTRAGMPLTQAVQNTKNSSYGPLDDHIEKMSAQIEWGVPFDEVLENFGEKTGSPLVRRSIETITQAYNSGGDIEDVLESVGDNIRSIKKLKAERQSQLYGEMVTGYMVYFIFIGILVALMTFLLPNLADASDAMGGDMSVFGGSDGPSLEQNIATYEIWFSRLVYIQAIFSGLIIGKLSEGQLKAGLKHSALLFACGYLILTFFL